MPVHQRAARHAGVHSRIRLDEVFDGVEPRIGYVQRGNHAACHRKGPGRRRCRRRIPARPVAGPVRCRSAQARFRRPEPQCRSRRLLQSVSPAGCVRPKGECRSDLQARPYARPSRQVPAATPRRSLPAQRPGVRPRRPGAARPDGQYGDDRLQRVGGRRLHGQRWTADKQEQQCYCKENLSTGHQPLSGSVVSSGFNSTFQHGESLPVAPMYRRFGAPQPPERRHKVCRFIGQAKHVSNSIVDSNTRRVCVAPDRPAASPSSPVRRKEQRPDLGLLLTSDPAGAGNPT